MGNALLGQFTGTTSYAPRGDSNFGFFCNGQLGSGGTATTASVYCPFAFTMSNLHAAQSVSSALGGANLQNGTGGALTFTGPTSGGSPVSYAQGNTVAVNFTSGTISTPCWGVYCTISAAANHGAIYGAGGGSVSVPNFQALFQPLCGNPGYNSTSWDASSQRRAGVAGTCSRLSIYVSSAPGGPNAGAAFYKNGGNGSQGVSVASGLTGTFTDTTYTDTLAVGDLFCAQLTGAVSGSATFTIASVVVGFVNSASAASDVCMASGSGQNAMRYYSLIGRQVGQTTEGYTYITHGWPGKLTQLAVSSSINSSTAAQTVVSRINAVNGALNSVIGAGLTGWFTDTTNQDIFQSTDTVNTFLSTTSPSGGITIHQICLTETSGTFASTWNVGVTESGSAADTTDGPVTYATPVVEGSATAADIVSSIGGYNTVITDTGAAVDTVANTAAFLVQSITETGTATDTTASLMPPPVFAIIETGAATDTLDGITTFNTVISETGSAAEDVHIPLYSVSISETGSATDVVDTPHPLVTYNKYFLGKLTNNVNLLANQSTGGASGLNNGGLNVGSSPTVTNPGCYVYCPITMTLSLLKGQPGTNTTGWIITNGVNAGSLRFNGPDNSTGAPQAYNAGDLIGVAFTGTSGISAGVRSIITGSTSGSTIYGSSGNLSIASGVRSYIAWGGTLVGYANPTLMLWWAQGSYQRLSVFVIGNSATAAGVAQFFHTMVPGRSAPSQLLVQAGNILVTIGAGLFGHFTDTTNTDPAYGMNNSAYQPAITGGTGGTTTVQQVTVGYLDSYSGTVSNSAPTFNSCTDISISSSCYLNLFGSNTVIETNESNIGIKHGFPGKLTNYSGSIIANTLTQTATTNLRINGRNALNTFAIAVGLTGGWYLAGSSSNPVDVFDEVSPVDIAVNIPSGSTGAIQFSYFSFTESNVPTGLMYEQANAVDTTSIGYLYQGVITEQGSAVDAYSAVVNWNGAISDTLNAVDTTDGPVVYAPSGFTVAEVGNAVDTVTGPVTYGIWAITEVGSAVDTDTTIVTFNTGIVEVGNAADTIIPISGQYPLVIESGAATDTVAAVQNFLAPIVEVGGAIDSPGSIVAYVPPINEIGSATDHVSDTIVFAPAVNEAGSATDIFNSFAVYPSSVVEAGSAADTLNAIVTSQIIESGYASDAYVAVTTFNTSINEVGNASEGIGTLSIYIASIVESGSAVDVVIPSPSQYGVIISEAGSALESINPSPSQYLGLTIRETGAASDTFNVYPVYPTNIVEVGGATDTVSSTVVFRSSIVENGGATDTLGGYVTWPEAIVENGGAADTVSDVISSINRIIENGGATDAVSDIASIQCAIVEGVAQLVNGLYWSNDWTNHVWINNSLSVTANSGTDPIGGGTDASELIPTTVVDYHYTLQDITNQITPGGHFTLSWYVQPSGYTQAYLLVNGNAGGFFYATFNVATGTILASGISSGSSNPTLLNAGMISVGGGWYRIWITGYFQTQPAITQAELIIPNNSGALNYAGDGTSGLLSYGAQFTPGDSVVPYVQTTTAYGYAGQISATDTVAVARYLPVLVVTEAGNATDTVTGKYIVDPEIVETANAVDAPIMALSPGGLLVAETGVATDVVSDTAVLPSAIVETGAATDTVNIAAYTESAIIIESGPVTDLVSSVASSNVSIVESGAAADVTSSTAVMPSVIVEVGSATDTVVSSISALIEAIVEAGAAVDTTAITGIVTTALIIQEAGSASDTTTAALVGSTPLNITETGAATDITAVTSAVFQPVAVIEYGSVADQVAVASIIIPVQAIVETGNATDTYSMLSVRGVSIVESGNAVDVTNDTATMTLAIVEIGYAQEALTATGGQTKMVAEQGSAIDTVNDTAVLLASIVETGNAVDTQDTTSNLTPLSIVESGSAVDTVNAVTQASILSVIESGSATDSTSLSLGGNLSIIESGSSSDIYTSVMIWNGLIVEAGNATDVYTSHTIYSTHITEITSATDFVVSISKLAPLYVIESGNAIDIYTSIVVTRPGIIETGGATDTVTSASTVSLAIVESASAVDYTNITGIVFTPVAIHEFGNAQDRMISTEPSVGNAAGMSKVIGLVPLYQMASVGWAGGTSSVIGIGRSTASSVGNAHGRCTVRGKLWVSIPVTDQPPQGEWWRDIHIPPSNNVPDCQRGPQPTGEVWLVEVYEEDEECC